jgi:hypothetical protein
MLPTGPGNNDLIHVTGRQLSLREQGQARKEVFREQVGGRGGGREEVDIGDQVKIVL